MNRRGDGSGLRVRPYALTGGRTRAATDIAIETILVLTPEGAARAEHRPMEKGDILRLCRAPSSPAEISAHLHLPLGVARVLAGDLVDEGLLDFNREAAAGDPPSLRLLERVFDGLQAL
ncbi:MAG TPA: DUF742 domain-containing protein [Acidimicrobiales bacterium]|nr:DUF742 domain-containing protein [Acidimicrobiales bacterium]